MQSDKRQKEIGGEEWRKARKKRGIETEKAKALPIYTSLWGTHPRQIRVLLNVDDAK